MLRSCGPTAHRSPRSTKTCREARCCRRFCGLDAPILTRYLGPGAEVSLRREGKVAALGAAHGAPGHSACDPPNSLACAAEVIRMRRRDFLVLFGSAVVSQPGLSLAQSTAPTIGFLNSASAASYAHLVGAFRGGLGETGYDEGRNVVIEYRWAENRYDRLPDLAAGLVRRQVAVIAATGADRTAVWAKAATKTIPIVFTSSDDPVSSGLVASLSRPGGNVTVRPAAMWEKFSTAPNPAICRCSIRPGSSWSSIAGPPRRSTSRCRRACSRLPTRSSSERGG